MTEGNHPDARPEAGITAAPVQPGHAAAPDTPDRYAGFVERVGERPDGRAEAPARGLGGAIMDTARRNPVGTALTAAGVALLFAPRVERDDAARAYGRARDRVRDMADRATPEAEALTARAKAQAEAAEQAAEDRIEAFRDRIEEGTEELGEAARARVVAARRRAIEARDRAAEAAGGVERRAEETARAGASDLRAAYQEHPLMAGALAVAAGAALGAALPRTRAEDAHLGEMAQRLTTEAEELVRRERDRALGAADGALQETREMTGEAAEALRARMPRGDEAVEAAEEALRESADRMAERARRGARG
jgi:hypothetical protein